MKKVVWYVALAAGEPMQQSLLHQILDAKLADLPLHKQLMKQFTTKEIITGTPSPPPSAARWRRRHLRGK